jgi:hypothetical protein
MFIRESGQRSDAPSKKKRARQSCLHYGVSVIRNYQAPSRKPIIPLALETLCAMKRKFLGLPWKRMRRVQVGAAYDAQNMVDASSCKLMRVLMEGQSQSKSRSL